MPRRPRPRDPVRCDCRPLVLERDALIPASAPRNLLGPPRRRGGTVDRALRQPDPALESLLIEKGLLSSDVVDKVVSTYENDIGPMIGAKIGKLCSSAARCRGGRIAGC